MSELEGEELDIEVFKIVNPKWNKWGDINSFEIPKYSTDWNQGGPLIEEHGIHITFINKSHWRGIIWGCDSENNFHTPLCFEFGPTPLVAAMRALVESKEES